MTNEEKAEIAQSVREAIDSLPPFENMTFTIDEPRIFRKDIAGQIWWRVPVTPHPIPRRKFSLYEAMTEIEFFLEDERGLHIDLVTGYYNDPEPPETAEGQAASAGIETAGTGQRECRKCITEERKAEIAQMVRDAIAETPIRDGRRLEVDEKAIEAWPTVSVVTWVVPVVTTPAPRRRSQMDETFFAIQDRIQAEHGVEIMLDTETAPYIEAPEPALT